MPTAVEADRGAQRKAGWQDKLAKAAECVAGLLHGFSKLAPQWQPRAIESHAVSAAPSCAAASAVADWAKVWQVG